MRGRGKKRAKKPGRTLKQREMIRENIMKNLESETTKYEGLDGFKQLAKKIGENPYVVYISVGKDIRNKLGWTWKVKQSTEVGRMSEVLKKYTDLAIKQVDIKKLHKNMNKKECMAEIKKQLHELGVPSWYDVGVAKGVIEAKEGELKEKGILSDY